MPVQVEKPSVGSLVVEVHPHGQHDVVAPVVLRLDTNIYDFFIICTDGILATFIITTSMIMVSIRMIKNIIMIVCLIFSPFNKLPRQVCYVALQTGYCKG